MWIPLKEGMKAERIGGERERDLTDNFNILWILSNFIEICQFILSTLPNCQIWTCLSVRAGFAGRFCTILTRFQKKESSSMLNLFWDACHLF